MVGYALKPRLHGIGRPLEVALTVAALPLLLLSIGVAAVWVARLRFQIYATPGLFVVAIPFSAAGFYCFARAVQVDHWPALWLTIALLAAASLRELLRWRARRSARWG